MSPFRRIVLWIAVNVPLGPLNPWLMKVGLKAKSYRRVD